MMSMQRTTNRTKCQLISSKIDFTSVNRNNYNFILSDSADGSIGHNADTLNFLD